MRHWLAAVAAAFWLAGTGVAGAATIFDFQFDNSGLLSAGGTIDGTLVGTGRFTSPLDLAPGLYTLSSLPGLTLQFTFANASFTQADILTPLTDVAIRIAPAGGAERLTFTEPSTGGDSGPFTGALDLANDGQPLSFEPTYVGGNDKYFESFDAISLLGNYVALSAASVPEPASLALLAGGMLMLAVRRRQAARPNL